VLVDRKQAVVAFKCGVRRRYGTRASRDHAPENLNILRKTALSKKHITRMSGPKRRFAASCCTDYMFTALFGK
jgi:hypothetical protein